MHSVCVPLQVVRSVETLSTQLALVRLFSCVSSAVLTVVLLRKEFLPTKLATEKKQIKVYTFSVRTKAV